MPHLTLEYTTNLEPAFDAGRALQRINAALAASGQFQDADIKSRAIGFAQFAIGTDGAPRGFVHVKLSILAGRPADTKRQLSEGVLVALQRGFEAPRGVEVQLCVELLELDGPSYAKAVVNG